jgi:hypothetical protein
VASNTYPAANYYWARIDTVGGISAGDTASWSSLAARDTLQDVFMEFTDSSNFNFRTFVNGTDYYYNLNALRWQSGLMSYSGSIIDYVARQLSYNQNGSQPPGVEVGIYSGNTYSSVSDMPSVVVRLSASSTTEPEPSISIDNDSLWFTMVEGASNPTTQTNVISNGSGGALTCQSFSDDSAWTNLITYDDPAPYTISNSISAGGRPAGTYVSTVTVVCDDASNSPQTYKIVLVITSPPTVAPEAATQKRTGYRRD